MKKLNKKIIIFNGQSLVGSELFGVQRYTIEILKEIDKIIDVIYDVELVVPAYINVKFKNIKIVVLKSNYKSKIFKYIWNYIIFDRYIKQKKGIVVDLLLGYPLYCDILAIHDCIMKKYNINANTLFKKFTRVIERIRIKLAIKTAKQIVTVSNASKEDIHKYYGIDKKNITVVYSACDHCKNIVLNESILEKLNLRMKDFMFSLGSRYKHKNFKWILEAAKQNEKYMFVVSGSRSQSISDRDIENEKIDNIIFTDYLTDSDIATLMRNCKAYISPSIAEGFGLTPLEALSFGAKIIISDIPCHKEIFEDCAYYINPNDYDKINIDTILSHNISDSSKILNKFSFNKSAKKILEVIEKL